MKTTFNWGDDTIDSRDIISRYEELQDELDTLISVLEEAQNNFDTIDQSDDTSLVVFQDAENSIMEAQEALDQFNQSFDKDELDTLAQVISEGEDSPDWSHGDILIRESYFTDYIKDMINDCYAMPKEFDSHVWPYNHVKMDWEAAAEEAKSDYNTIEVDGHTYYIRA
jgi:hypothetical protein